MPRMIDRTIGLGGLGDIQTPPHLLGAQWRDCDHVRVLDGPRIRQWGGHQRMGMRLLDANLGAAGNRIDLVAFSQHWLRKPTGQGIVAVDRNSETAGRILGGAYHSGGINGDLFFGQPVQTAGSGLSDIEVRGIWEGGELSATNRGILKVQIVSGDPASPNTKRISVDGGTTWGAPSNIVAGEWFTVGGGIEARFLAATGHDSGDTWTIPVGGRPMLVGSMNRRGPHQYPRFVGADGKTLIFDEWNRVLVHEGQGAVREAGLEKPHIKPSVRAHLSIQDDDLNSDADDIGETDDDPISWVAISPVTVSRQTTNPDPADGAAYIKLVVPYSLHAGKVNLAYVNKSGTIKADLRRVRVYLRGKWTRGIVKGGSLAIVFNDGTALGGTTSKYAIIRNAIFGSKWTRCDCEIRVGNNDFNYQSIGLRMWRSIGASGNVYDFAEGGMVLYMDRLDTEAEAGGGGEPTVGPSEVFRREGEWYFRFSWHSRALKRTSAPSPVSDPLKLDGEAVRLDLSGWYPGVQAGLQNSPPDWADSVIVYAGNVNFGQDQRLGRGISFFRVTPPDGIELARLSDPDGIGQLVVDLSDETAVGELNDESPNTEQDPFFNGLPLPGRWAVSDGPVIVSGGQSPAKHKFNVANGSGLVTAYDTGDPETTVHIGKWMEGRIFHRLGDSKLYRVVKALDTDDDGVLDALWIGTDFDPTLQEMTALYQGETGEGVDCIISGDDNEIAWTNVTGPLGVDIEASSPAARSRPFAGDDRPVTAIKLDEFLFILGEKSVAIYKQNTGTLEDLPTLGSGSSLVPNTRYSSPAVVRGPSCGAPDTACVAPDGTAYWLGMNGQLYMAKANQVAEHPLSPRIASILSGKGFLSDTKSMRHSWMTYFEDGQGKYLYLGVVSSPKPVGVSFVEAAEDERSFALVVGDNSVPVIVDAGATYAYPWFTDGPLVSDWPNQQPLHPTHFHPFSPRPWTYIGTLSGTDYYEWIDPWGVQVLASSAAIFGWAAPWDLDQLGDGEVELVDLPAGLAIETGKNSFWPTNTAALDPPYHDLEFNKPDHKCYRFNIKTSAEAGRLFTSYNLEVGVDTGYPDKTGLDDMTIPREAKGMGFWVMSDETIPAGKLRFTFVSDYWASPYQITYGTEIPADTWHFVYLDFVANPPAEAFYTGTDAGRLYPWKDKDGNEIVGFDWDEFGIDLTGPVSIETNLYVTGGRLIFDEYSVVVGEPSEPLMDADCTSYSGLIEQGTMDADFEYGILIDLGRGLILPGSDCRFTRPVSEPGAGCAVAGQPMAQRFWGTRDGYIHRTFDDGWLSWGGPSSMFIFGAEAGNAGGAATFNIDRSFAGAPDKLSLPVDIDGNGLLSGLLAAKISANLSVETRRIQSNTAGTVTVAENWSNAPVDTDKIIIGELHAVFHSSEFRTQFESLMREWFVTCHERISTESHPSLVNIEPFVKAEIYSASGGAYQSELSDGPSATAIAKRSDFEQGDGFREIAPVTSKARSVKFTMRGGQTGQTDWSNFQARERIHERESMR
jgi:hypothetical protein